MNIVERKLTKSFKAFFDSEKAGGIVLILCTVISLTITNFVPGEGYLAFWHMKAGDLSIEHWINDGLMAIFFLLIGLELERELYNGELSNFKNALLPIFAALGGVAVPALTHFWLNRGLPTQAGVGIPMATDIAFALGVLALLGQCVPASLKVFVVALAVIDDLCAIIIIAIFYAVTTGLSRLPLDLNWRHIFGAGILGGIGFTMSIFITNLAFTSDADMINASKMAILLASLTAGVIALLWLKLFGKPKATDSDTTTMDFEPTH